MTDVTATVRNIEVLAVVVREVADRLTKRVEAFEDHLARMPGRVETAIAGPHFTLAFLRIGSKWRLVHRRGEDEEYKPLSDGSLKVKMEAVGMFEDLVTSILRSQETLIAEMESAIAETDQLFAALAAKGKERD